jgi:molecular chaperone GrpE
MTDDLNEKIKQAEQEAAKRDQDDAQNDDGQSSGQGAAQDDELEKYKELAKRTMADFQNYKRRQESERSEMFKMANESLFKKLLPALDNFQRAKSEIDQETQKGVLMSIEILENAVKEFGLESLNPELGSEFKPEEQEALLQADGKENTVVEVLETGYKLGNKVLRNAKVKVGNGNV